MKTNNEEIEKRPNWLEKNPVDYYNENHKETIIKLLLAKNKTLRREGNKFFEEHNSSERVPVYSFSQGYFLVLANNKLALKVDETYSPFQLLVRLKFKNNFKAAFLEVGIKYMDMKFPYMRVGVDYFKSIKSVDRFNIVRDEIVKWRKDEIKQDYGADMLERVTKYDSFCLEPSNNTHSLSVNGHYNQYAPNILFQHRQLLRIYFHHSML